MSLSQKGREIVYTSICNSSVVCREVNTGMETVSLRGQIHFTLCPCLGLSVNVEGGGNGGAPTLSCIDPLSIAVLEASRVASEPSAAVAVGVGALMGEKGG